MQLLDVFSYDKNWSCGASGHEDSFERTCFEKTLQVVFQLNANITC